MIPVQLKKGADVNAKNNDGQTPLNVATYRGYTDIVTLLPKKEGANVNTKDKIRDTPLHYASYYRKNEVIPVL